MHSFRTHLVVATICLLLGVLSGCAPDFEPYNVVSDFRLLALQADPPELLSGQSTMLRAFVTDPSATYAWSWCPVYQDKDDGSVCAITQAEFQQLVDDALGNAAPTVPDFDLGSGATANFDYAFSSQIAQGLCAGIVTTGLPDNAVPPDCFGSSFRILIRLRVEAGGKVIEGIRDVPLLYDDTATPNQNPTFTNAFVVDGSSETVIDDTATVSVERGIEQALRVEVDIAQSESYMRENDDGTLEPDTEDLVVTWFVEGGDTDRIRTSYFAGELPIENLQNNTWIPPTTNDRAETTSRLFFVLRDNRGGTVWQQYSVTLENTP